MATLSSPGRKRVFVWFSAERETTEANFSARDTVGHAPSHSLGFVTTQVSQCFDDGDLSSLLMQSLAAAKEKPLARGHSEMAIRALQELYQNGVSESRTGTVNGGGRPHHLGSTTTRCSGLYLDSRGARITAGVSPPPRPWPGESEGRDHMSLGHQRR